MNYSLKKWHFEFVVEHDNSENILDQYKHLMVHFLSLIDVFSDQLSGLDAGGAYHVIVILLQFLFKVSQFDTFFVK
jgi:hypothetical protein